MSFLPFLLGFAPTAITAVWLGLKERHQHVMRCRADMLLADVRQLAGRQRETLVEQLDEIAALEWDVAQRSADLCDANARATRDDGIISRLANAFCHANQRRRAAVRELAVIRARDSKRVSDGNRTKARRKRADVQACAAAVRENQVNPVAVRA